MKKTFVSVKKSLKTAIALLRIQLGFGFAGVFTQFLYVFMNAVKTVVPILLPKFIIDACTKGDLSLFVIILVSASAFSWFVDSTIGITEWAQTVYNLKFAHYFKRRISEKAMTMDYRDLENSEALDGLERAMDAAYYGLSDMLFTDLLTRVLLLAFLIATISVLNAWIVLATLVFVLALYFINRRATEVNHRFDMEKSGFKRQREYAEKCVLDFEAAKDIRANAAETMLFSKFEEASEGEIKVQRRKNRFNLLMGLVRTLLNAVMIGGMYVYLIFSYSDGLVVISSFTVYLTALSEFYGAVNGVFESLLNFKESRVNFDEVEGILGREETILRKGKDFAKEIETIEFKNVTFTYPGQSKPAIKNLSLKINRGDSVILVGENGAGKTTLVKLLLRLYDVDSGEILVNGRDIREFSYGEYIARFSPVFQEVWMFAYSVKENIAFSENADGKALDAALTFAGIKDRLAELPAGVDTYCTKNFDENGVNFSGGEEQKISIARAMYRGGDVVIMDEPNSALDAISEKQLSENMRGLMTDDGAEAKVLLLISHRLSMSRFCSRVAVLDGGEIIEQGSHDELISLGGRYAELYQIQADQYK